MKRSFNTSNPQRCGATAVEFAIVLPVVFLLFFGFIEMARVNMIRNAMRNAAYEGARTAIIPGGKANKAKKTAQSMLETFGVANASVKVTPKTIKDDTPEISITVTVPLNDNTWVTPSYFGNYSLKHECKMTREGSNSSY